jgi:raffinose/stachyose/melibiose transport system permease protein
LSNTVLGKVFRRTDKDVTHRRVPKRITPMASGRRRLIGLFLFPALLFYLVFFIGPALASIYLSLTNWKGLGSEMEFVGLGNYRDLLQDPKYWLSFWNTIQILLVVGVSVFLVSFLFMVLLREMAGRKFIRAVIFFPNIVAPVALAIAWGFLLNPDTGLVNTTLASVGLGGLQQVWLSPSLILESIMAALIWIYVGFFATILMSAVDRIPRYYYEVCEIEGASGWQMFRHVTLPMSWDVISVAATLWVITSIKIFEFIYAFGGVGAAPPINSWSIGVFMFMITLGNRSPIFELGYGTAIAITMVILTAILILLVRRLMRREAIEF